MSFIKGSSSSFKADYLFDLSNILLSMKEENSQFLKEPCFSSTLISEDRPDCSKGSPWIEKYGQTMMGGQLPDGIRVSTQDAFHRVWTMTPHHLPQFNNTCDNFTKSAETPECILHSVTVTELAYADESLKDEGAPVATLEFKVKLLSRQATYEAAGNHSANFHELDELGNPCGDINQAAIDWSYQHLSPEAK